MTDETSRQIDAWFTYHAPTPEQAERLERVRNAAKTLAVVIATCTPTSADQTAALRKLREAVMTANAAIVLEGTVVNPKRPDGDDARKPQAERDAPWKVAGVTGNGRDILAQATGHRGDHVCDVCGLPRRFWASDADRGCAPKLAS